MIFATITNLLAEASQLSNSLQEMKPLSYTSYSYQQPTPPGSGFPGGGLNSPLMNSPLGIAMNIPQVAGDYGSFNHAHHGSFTGNNGSYTGNSVLPGSYTGNSVLPGSFSGNNAHPFSSGSWNDQNAVHNNFKDENTAAMSFGTNQFL